jgi:ABC-type spermidine/putrescine transport system permease subunit II
MVLAFLVLPILAVIPASFNHASFIRLPPDAWSLRWYQAFLNDPEWWRALVASMRVALLATIISVTLGTAAALGLERVTARMRTALLAIVISPLIVPVIMTSIALYYVMRPLGLHGTTLGLALGHTLLAVPFVVVNVGISLRGSTRTACARRKDWARRHGGCSAPLRCRSSCPASPVARPSPSSPRSTRSSCRSSSPVCRRRRCP